MDEIRALTPEDAAAALALFDTVWRETPAGFLTKRSAVDFMTLTGPESGSVGCFDGGRLVAYAMGRLLPAGHDSAPRRGGLLRRPDETVGMLHGTLVHADFRGRGLHGRLYVARRDLLVARGATQHMGIVFLDNLLSLDANLKCGLLVRGLMEDADGMNFLVYVDTLESVRPDEAAEEWIAWSDLPRQEEALLRGLRGWALRRDGNTARIRYAPATT